VDGAEWKGKGKKGNGKEGERRWREGFVPPKNLVLHSNSSIAGIC